MWKWGEEGNKEKVHESHPEEFPGYYMEFNSKTKKEIESYVRERPDQKTKIPATQFGVKRDGDTHIILVDYKQFFEADFNSLYTSIGDIVEKQYIAKVEEHQQRSSLV